MKLAEALERFVQQMRADGRSPSTIGTYARHLRALDAWPHPLPVAAAELLTACAIDPRRRPETLDIPEFVRLADALTAATAR